MAINNAYDAVVIGASAGGLYALMRILQPLPIQYPLPVMIVQHRSKDERDLLEEVLQQKCSIRIKQADEKEHIQPPSQALTTNRIVLSLLIGHVYTAHKLIVLREAQR